MPKATRYGLILAGGRGTRFWPRSRTRTPKQLLPFVGPRSLLQDTVERLRPLIPPERIWILTNEYLRRAVRKQLPEVPPEQILAEPAQRNTAPCLGLAARIIAERDPSAVLGVFPADHYIAKPSRFRQFLKPAFQAAEQGRLVTLGIEPRWPETGYGYLEFPAGLTAGSLTPFPVRRFREKPDLATAQDFLRAGHFYWNAGMFFWRAGRFNECLRQYLPKTAAILASLPAFGTLRFNRRLRETFPLCENISVDFAVMEKAAQDGLVAGLATDDFGWNDLGSWNAVHELLPGDASGNVLRADALVEDASGCYVEVTGKLIALLGVRDLIVVDTPGAILIADRNRAQDVGKIVRQLEQRRRDELL